jgi:sphingomyelin phosphodiesterase
VGGGSRLQAARAAVFTARNVLYDGLEHLLSEASINKIEASLGELGRMPPLACSLCRLMWGTVNGLLDEGRDFDESRDAVLDVCLAVLNGTDARADLLCEGAVDSYGPHVFFIAEEIQQNATVICEQLNSCDARGEEPERTARKDAPQKVVGAQPEAKGDQKRRQIPENAIKVAHLTDIHVDEKYFVGGATRCGLPVCCREDAEGTGSAGMWGNYWCNAPPETTEEFLRQVAAQEPDFVIHSGDNPSHVLWEETQETQLRASKWVTDAMKRLMPGLKVYPSVGNHECYPANMYYPPREEIQELNEEFFEWWRDLADFDEDNEETVKYAGYYSRVVRDGLRLISYNSNFGYTYNWYNLLNVDREELPAMQAFMEEQMAEAAQEGEKVILVGHHPTGQGDSAVYWGQYLTDLVLRYHDIIVLHVHGHTHKDEFRLFVDPEDGVAKGISYVGGTTNPLTNNNPQARMFYLDPDTFEVLDYEHYILDLMEAYESGEGAETPITLSYTATEEYGLADMSPAAWQDLTYRMSSDRAEFDVYWSNIRGKSNATETCGPRCYRDEICLLQSSSYDLYMACKDAA